MKTSTLISRTLRDMDFPESHVRELRAMFVAQVVAYKVSLEGESVEQVIETNTDYMKEVLNGVNEFTPVDVTLCMDLFTRIVKSRWELLYGCKDVSLILHALCSDELKTRLNRDTKGIAAQLTSLPKFNAATEAVLNVLNTPQDRE